MENPFANDSIMNQSNSADPSPSTKDIFGGDDVMLRLMDEAARGKQTTTVRAVDPVSGSSGQWLKALLAANMLLLTLALGWLVFSTPRVQMVQSQPQPKDQPVAGGGSATTTPAASERDTLEPPRSADDFQMSFMLASQYYSSGDYEGAIRVLRRLRATATARADIDPLLSDYFELKLALCNEHMDDVQSALAGFSKAAKSRSPFVSAFALYRAAALNIGQEDYSAGAAKLYGCIALLDALRPEVAGPLASDCSFMMATTFAKPMLERLDRNHEHPGDLWKRQPMADPAASLPPAALLEFISFSADRIAPITTITSTMADQEIRQWTISARQAHVSALLADILSKDGITIQWNAPDSHRSILLDVYIANRSIEVAAESVAGAAGLAIVYNEKTATVFAPESVASGARNGGSQWQTTEALRLLSRFILLYNNDPSVASAWFARAAANHIGGSASAAATDYKLLVSRFPTSPHVPAALWNSSMIKLAANDLSGAREDLTVLTDSWPDIELYGKAGIKLAQITASQGQHQEAQRLFRRTYDINTSLEIQTEAAFGAARSFFALGDSAQAAEWFTRYIKAERDQRNPNVYTASLSLGIAMRNMGRLEASAEALRFCLDRHLQPAQQINASIELARTLVQSRLWLESLAVLEELPLTLALNDDEIAILQLRSSIYCEIAMPHKAVVLLHNAMERAIDRQRAASLAIPLARSLRQAQEIEKARHRLAQTLSYVESSQLANEIQCELAEVELLLGNHDAAISLSIKLIAARPSDALMERAYRIMGRAYWNMSQYENAALAFAGRIAAGGDL